LFVALAQISCGNGSSETRDQDPLALQPENALDCCDGGAGAARDASVALDAGGASGTRGKFVGNITTTGAVRSDFASLWDQITPENEGKWGSVEPVRNQMNWAPLDRIYAYARQHGIPVKAHTLVWGSQQPGWLSRLTPAQQAAEIEEWIRSYCQRFPDTALIDVVNEPPPHTTPVYVNALGGAGASGYDWIVKAFKLTKKYCPRSLLILNDYNNIEYSADQTRFIQIAKAVKRAGAPIDAVGAQAHDAYKVPTATLQQNITRLAQETGLPVYISEYDINLAGDAQQAQVMESQFTMFWNHPSVVGITLWGYVSGATWLPNTGLMSSSGTPRPALTWLRDFLRRSSTTSGTGTPPQGGAAACDLPKTFAWRSTGPLISPKSPEGHNFVSLKDPSVVHANDLFHVHATVFDQRRNEWSMVYLNFRDWSQAGSAAQYPMANSPTRGGVAPQMFYFAPKNQWVLVYQWGASYSTSDDPSRPERWTTRKPLLVNGPQNAIDFWVICDSANCHLFFSANDGKLYKSKMPASQFPGTFNGYSTVMSDSVANLFEASNVYKIDGFDKYLLLVEAMGPRYFRSWTSSNLDGPWTPLAATQQNPFAGKANVTFEGGAAWTNDISHGDMVRTNPDQTMTIDACNMQFVYQGVDPAKASGSYNTLPYRLGLLSLIR
jgi:GH35 family endo-1,4-beta-xylanase